MCNDMIAQSKVAAGEIPERGFGRIADPLWGVLERCWSKFPAERPPLVELYNGLSSYCTPPPGIAGIPQEMHVILVFFSISPSPAAGTTVGDRFYVKFKYGKGNFGSPWTHDVPEFGAGASWDWCAHFCALRPCR